MTTITYNPLPDHFAHLNFIDELPALFDTYKNSFGEAEQIIIDVKVHFEPKDFPKIDSIWSEDLLSGTINLPFTQRRNGKTMTELPDENEFYASIQRALDLAVLDYEKKLLEETGEDAE